MLASRSGLFPLLKSGHYDVKLSREELDKSACWIDLLVPYCGDYTEAAAWSEPDQRKYEQSPRKRQRMEETERQNLRELLTHWNPGD
jgi:hypothetical protein